MSAVESLQARFLAREPAQQPGTLATLRETAMQRFAALGFPTSHDEAWRYTNVTPIAKLVFSASEPMALAALPQALQHDAQLVFVNGRYAPALSSARFADGVSVSSLAETLRHTPDTVLKHLGQTARLASHAFVALNTAFLEDGAFVQVPKASVVKTPIRLLYLNDARAGVAMAHPRTLVVLDDSAQASIVEMHVTLPPQLASSPGAPTVSGSEAALVNPVTELVLGENARLDYLLWQDQSHATFHIASLWAAQARASALSLWALGFGGALARSELHTTLGEGASAHLSGLSLGQGQQTQDVLTYVDHVAPHGTSRQTFKAILADKSISVFDGRVRVAPHAQKTDAAQKNQNLLLSNDAQATSKPHLEIYADDVKCAHGATSGQLAEEALFYFRSRGIAEAEARALLAFGFASEVLDGLATGGVADAARARLSEWLHGR